MMLVSDDGEDVDEGLSEGRRGALCRVGTREEEGDWLSMFDDLWFDGGIIGGGGVRELEAEESWNSI